MRPDLIAGRAFVLIEAIDRTRVVLARAQQYLTQWANRIQSVGTITLKVSIAAAIPLGYAVKQFADFENRMSRISILMDEPNKYMETATQRIRELAMEYGKSTDEIQDAFTVMVSGGMDPSKLLAKDEFEAVLQTAVATRSEIKNVAEGARRMAMAYGLTVREATDFMLAVDVGGVDFNEMAGGLGRAAGMAQMAGISFQEFGAMIGGISMVLPTDEVITAINNMSAKVFPGGASKDAIEVAKEFGINLEEMVLQGRTFMDLLKQIWLMPGKSEAQVNKALAELFPDIRGRKGLSQLVMNPANYYRMLKLVQESGGRTTKAWDIVKDDTLVNLTKAWQSINNIALSLGSKLKPATSAASKLFSIFSKNVATFIDENQRAVVGVTAATAAFLALGGALVTAGLALRLLSFSLTPLMVALWLVYSPFAALRMILMATIGVVGSLVASLTGLVGIFTAMNSVQLLGVALLFRVLYSRVMENKDAITQLSASYSQWLQTNLSAQLGGFLGWFDQMSAKAVSLGDTLKVTFMGLTDAIMAGDLQAAWDITLKGLELSWLQLIDMFRTTWEAFAKYFIDVFSTLESMRKNAVVNLGTKIAQKGGFWKWLAKSIYQDSEEWKRIDPDTWGFYSGPGDTEHQAKKVDELTAAIARERAEIQKLDAAMGNTKDWIAKFFIRADIGRRANLVRDMQKELEELQNPEAVHARERTEELRQEYLDNTDKIKQYRAEIEQATKQVQELIQQRDRARKGGLDVLFGTDVMFNPKPIEGRVSELTGLIQELETRQKEIAVEVGQLTTVPDKKLPGATAEQWEQSRQQMLKHGITEPTESNIDKKLKEYADAFDKFMADETGKGAQDPEQFRKNAEPAREIRQRQEELTALRNQIAERRAVSEVGRLSKFGTPTESAINEIAMQYADTVAGKQTKDTTHEQAVKWSNEYLRILPKLKQSAGSPIDSRIAELDVEIAKIRSNPNITRLEGLGVTQLSDTGLTDRITKIDEEIRTLNNVLRQSLFEGKPGIDDVATINHIKQLQNSRDELTRFELGRLVQTELDKLEQLNRQRDELVRQRSETSGGIRGELIDAFKNPAMWDMFLPGLSNAANAASQVLGVVANKITGISEESKVKGGIPATETIMAQSKEEADMIKRIWQEQHLPADKGKEQEESAVRKKLLEVLPQINNWLQQIASAEGI